MGMFDSFILRAKCPYCGNDCDTEFQTKRFRCVLNVWKKGDKFDEGFTIIDGTINEIYGSCRVKGVENCGWEWERKNRPNMYGFGRPFLCDVKIENGVVQKAINVRGVDDGR
jgi:hypothetical protein